MKCYCLIQTEKRPCSVPLVQKYAQIPTAERGTEPLTNSRKHNAGKMKTWKKPHNFTWLFQTKVCTTENIHLHHVCACVYIYIYIHAHTFMHMLPPVSLPLHFVIALSLSLPWRKAGNPWLPSAIYRITIWAINFGTLDRFPLLNTTQQHLPIQCWCIFILSLHSSVDPKHSHCDWT